MKNVDENSAHQKTFESFNAGNHNQAAVHIAQEFCSQDKNDLVNPLFVFGESGSGKTHLLLAMKDKLERENPDMIVEYAIGSELIGSLIDAYCSLSKRSKSHSGNDDRKNPFDELRAVDALLIDDVEPRQFGSNAALDILQQMASSYACKGRRIAVASSYLPTDFCFDSDSNPLRFQKIAVELDRGELASEGETANEGMNGLFPSDKSLLKASEVVYPGDNTEQLAQTLQQALEDFGIMAMVVDWNVGPAVTLFKVSPPTGVRVSRIEALSDDIALALGVPSVRIYAPVPDTRYVGIEVPNAAREDVLLADVVRDMHGGPLEMAIGKDVEGSSIVLDLAELPHVLIGGELGSGMDAAIEGMLASILVRAKPSEARFIMIDPKRVDLVRFSDAPHLLTPIVSELDEAAAALAWAANEVDSRIKTIRKAGVRNVDEYNALAQSTECEPTTLVGPSEQVLSEGSMPRIVVVIDKLDDLMINMREKIEPSISSIAQRGRTAGVHLIIAAQRASANVITGFIKASITCRISFKVASSLDSRVILEAPGAESLIGLGDSLLSLPKWAKPIRVQACYVSAEDVEAVVESLSSQPKPDYRYEILEARPLEMKPFEPGGHDDPLLWDAAEIVVASALGSYGNVQRKLKVGYSRAQRMLDTLEELGIVGPSHGPRPREVLMDEHQLDKLKEAIANGKCQHHKKEKAPNDGAAAIDAGTAASLAFESICQMAEQKRHMHPQGVMTGFKDIDDAFHGIHPGDLVSVSGLSGVGKTSLALNIAVNAAKLGAKVLVFAQATDATETMIRILSSDARIAMSKLRRGYITENDWSAIAEASNRISALDISICDAPMLTMEGVEQTAGDYLLDAEKALIVVDDLDRIIPDGEEATDNCPHAIGLVTQRLKTLARTLNVCALATMSPSPGTNPIRVLKDARHTIEALAYMGGAESASDAVLLLDRSLNDIESEQRGGTSLGTASAYVVKNHYGPVERLTLAYVPEYLRFMDYADDSRL